MDAVTASILILRRAITGANRQHLDVLTEELERLGRLKAQVESWADGPASRHATNQERALMRGILETTE